VNLRQIDNKKLPNKVISGFFFAIFRWYLGSTFSLSLEKNDTIRLIPPYLVIGNHANFWDGALVNLFIKDPICFLVSDEYFRKPLLGWLLNIDGSIPKKKFLADFTAIKEALKAKEAGRIIGIFPEGKRNWDGSTEKVIFASRDSAGTLVYQGQPLTTSIPAASTDTNTQRYFFMNEEEELFVWAAVGMRILATVIYYTDGPERFTWTGVSPWKIEVPKGKRLVFHSVHSTRPDTQLTASHNATSGGPFEVTMVATNRQVVPSVSFWNATSAGQPVDFGNSFLIPIEYLPSGSVFEISFDTGFAQSVHTFSFPGRFVDE